jgi:chaperone required for assembly of F1-ATPase
MRDIFDDIFANQPLDPTEAARRTMRPQLRKRFYENAQVAEKPEGFAVELDGRPVRTPARRMLAAPIRPVAQLLADEWQAQSEMVDPARMPMTRLANTVIDGVADTRAEVAAEIENYLGSDLVFYRADAPEGLVARQARAWDPVVTWARDELGARFVLAQGVTFVRQPDHAVAAARAAIPSDPWRLGAVHAITTLTGSALIALMLARGRIPADTAWSAAHVDEDWNITFWGRDEVAMQRRDYRFNEMQAAASVFALMVRDNSPPLTP